MRRTLIKDLNLAATGTHYLSLPDAGGLKWRIVDIRLLSDATIATHASNYWTAALSGSDGSTAVGSWTSNSSGGTGLTAGSPYQITPAASLGKAGELDQSSGQSVKAVFTKTGTPSDFTGQLLIEVEAVS